MIGRPRPISVAQAMGYFLQESQGVVDLVEHEDFPPELAGSLLPVLGLKAGPFDLEQYADFVLGDFPALADKRLRLAAPAPVDAKAMQRALYEVTVSVPKSVSLQLLRSGDKRMNEVVRNANKAVMDMFEEYCIVRVSRPDGTVEKVRVQGIAYASWFHISSRERERDDAAEILGGADPQFHVHNLVHRLVLPVGASELHEVEGKDAQIAHQAADAVSGGAAGAWEKERP